MGYATLVPKLPTSSTIADLLEKDCLTAEIYMGKRRTELEMVVVGESVVSGMELDISELFVQMGDDKNCQDDFAL